MPNKFYTDLCIKAITGNINEVEKTVLASWLKKSSNNQKEFEQLKNVWNGIANFEQVSIPNIDVEWDKLHDRIINQGVSSDNKTKWYEFIPELLFKPLYKPAIASLVLIILLLVYIIQLKDEHFPIVSVSTKAGEKKTITLSDGSSVLLNYSSKIEYPKEFSETREVKLDGEAFFSVTKNAKQFRVKTANAVVSVLGTKFTIKSLGTKTDVFVKEGKVNLKQLSSNLKGVNLSTGQKSFVIANMLPSAPEIVDSGEELTWLNNVLTFNHTSLYEIKSELERLYGIPILIQTEEIGKLTLTGSFKVETKIDSVLDMICLALDLKYEKLQHEYTINKK
jgi:transmembrane sensor